MGETDASGTAPRRRLLGHAAAIAACGIWLLVFTWRKWPDAIVDFGRELYAPWRLSEGEVLYRDLAWFNGPLSAYWNALWFKVGGAGFGTLIAVNATLLAAFTALVYRTLLRLSYPLAALAGTLFFLFTFAFGQTCGIGNYNFMAPYSHEAVHGLMLAWAALAVLDAGQRDAGPRRAGAAGLLLGLAFLTKPEPFAAGLAGAFVALVLGAERGARARLSAACALGLALPPLAAFAMLSTAMPAGAAARGVLGAWPAVFAGDVARLPFYRGLLGTGLDAPLANLLAMLAWGAGCAAFLALGVLLGRRVPAARTFGGAALVALVSAVALVLAPIRWTDAGRPLPLILLVAAGALWLQRARSTDPGQRRLLARRLAFVVLALALLAKTLLVAKVWHYGFVLAVPASLAVAMALTCWLPERPDLPGATLGALGLGLFGALWWFYWGISAGAYAERRFEVGSGTDRIVADARGGFVQRALAEIEREVPPGGTLLVLPEGIMVNYLARRRAPAGHLNYMPPEMILFGEDAMLAALQASPPDAVLLIHKDTSEYGFPLFGRDYGRALMSWVRARYTQVWTDPAGDAPLEPGSRFGTGLLRPR